MTGRTSLLGVTEAGNAIAPFFSASEASAAAKQKDQNDNSSQHSIAPHSCNHRILATCARTMPQVGLLALPVIVILYLLSGSTTPLETMLAWLQAIMQFTPNTQFVSFAQAVLYRGAGVDLVWQQLLAMAAFGLVTLLLCRARFSKTISAAQ